MRFPWQKDPMAPMALYERGNELYASGDADGAVAAYQQAIDSGHQLAAAEAGIKLGIMHRRAGQHADAIAAYRAAMDTGHPDKAPTAAFFLAGVLSKDGRAPEAASTYEFVIESGHELRSTALLCLAEVCRYDLKQLRRAYDAYQLAADTGDKKDAPPALVGLADLLRTNAPERATELYERAVASGHAEAAPMARRALRGLRGDQEGTPSARHANGIDGCVLMLDGDGEVTGLLFEDPDVGDEYAADINRLKQLLIANDLMTLMGAGYRAAADADTGGYRITFDR